nr:rho GTPase-activating protein 11A isoform X1 [Pogona vitticeps]
MAAMEGRRKELTQLAVQQHLRAAYGIKIKTRATKGKPSRPAAVETGGGKIFGIAFDELPHQIVSEYGSIPCFLVEACDYLEQHMHTEGLFRKSGSFVRLKTLKSKLDQGENCLSGAPPCDVAGLLKQFFRELPEPILPSELQEALIKAQQLGNEEKISATLLLSCLINSKTIDTLRYFFKFLKNVSLRSAENKMDSNNLAVIFAPNLLQSSETDKISAHTERKLRLQAAVLQTFIDHAEDLGTLPRFILEKIPAMLGIDDPASTPSLLNCRENEVETPGEQTRKRSQSIGDIVSGALNKLKSNRTPSTTPQRDRNVFPSMTPVNVTPSFKRKYAADSCQGFSSKKRRSIRHNMGLELLPSSLFNISSTPGSAQSETSPSISLEHSLSTSVTSEKYLPRIGSRRSQRIANKKVQRVESGKMGCFSPKISRKEMMRKSLRLKFILGRSSKENTVVENLVSKRSEHIGRRLASQQDTESGVDSVKAVALLSPCIGESVIRKGPQNFSKSEENLQIVKHDKQASYRISWTGISNTESEKTSSRGTTSMAHLEAETSFSEPNLTCKGSPTILIKPRLLDKRTKQDCNNQQASFCEDENRLTTDTLLKIQKAFSESGSNLHNLLEIESSKSNLTSGTTCPLEVNPVFKMKAQETLKIEQEILFTSPGGEAHTVDKHLSNENQNNVTDGILFQNTAEVDSSARDLNKDVGSMQEEQLIARTHPITQLSSTNALQKEILESKDEFTSQRMIKDDKFKCCNSELKECLESGQLSSQFSEGGEINSKCCIHMGSCEKSKPSPAGKVADHIHWFNKLSLNEPCSATKAKPPLKFQRTPVRQSIRRINSLLEANKQSITCKRTKADNDCPLLVKSVSYETALSSCGERISKTSTVSQLPFEATCKQMSTSDQFDQTSKSHQQLACPCTGTSTTFKETITTSHSRAVLEDVTNHEASKTVVKMKTNLNVSVGTPDKCVIRKTGETKVRYRGSPRNPMATTKFLPVVKPLDL